MSSALRASAKLTKLADKLAYRLEQSDDGYGLVSAAPGTFVAANWTHSEGYGLSLAQIEAALRDV